MLLSRSGESNKDRDFTHEQNHFPSVSGEWHLKPMAVVEQAGKMHANSHQFLNGLLQRTQAGQYKLLEMGTK